MKLSEFLKQYTDEIINKCDDCDLDDLTEAQKEELMVRIYLTMFKIVEKLSDDVAENYVD